MNSQVPNPGVLHGIQRPLRTSLQCGKPCHTRSHCSKTCGATTHEPSGLCRQMQGLAPDSLTKGNQTQLLEIDSETCLPQALRLEAIDAGKGKSVLCQATACLAKLGSWLPWLDKAHECVVRTVVWFGFIKSDIPRCKVGISRGRHHCLLCIIFRLFVFMVLSKWQTCVHGPEGLDRPHEASFQGSRPACVQDR